MITDFHTHCYPDGLAVKALGAVHDVRTERSDGTYRGLKSALAEAGIDKAVVLPVCGRPDHEKTVNGFLHSLADENNKLIPFVSVHPFSRNAVALVKEYAAQGAKGIKFHTPLQNFRLDDERAVELYKTAADCGLITLFHCGKPGIYPSALDCYPSDFKKIMRFLNPEKTVLAHFGGYGINDEELNVLRALPFHIDTSLSETQFTKEKFAELLDTFDENKLLFGSDSPWRIIKTAADFVRSACRDEQKLRKIFYENAEKLLADN